MLHVSSFHKFFILKELYRNYFMAPNSPLKPILICSKCGRKGFIRTKQAKFHVPQRNKKFTFYQILDYVAKLSFARFIYELEHNTERKEWSLDSYRKIVPFSPHSKKELSEFEFKVRTRLNERVTGHNQYTFSEKRANEDISMFNRTNELSLLYFSLCFISLRKFMQYFNFRIEKNFEEDLINYIGNSFHALTFSSDKRNKLSFETLFNIMKDKGKVGLNYGISKNLKEFHPTVCRPCKKIYQESTNIKKCTKCGHRVDKVRSSEKYLRNRLEELETKALEFPISIYYFLAFTIVVRDTLFKEKSMKKIFKNFFYQTLSDYLADLKLHGTSYYVMVHSENGRKQQCYLNDENDILGIRILDKDYITAFKEAIRILVYGHDGHLNKNGVVVYNTLSSINFPVEYRHNKAMEDYKNFSLWDHNEERCKKYSELKPLMEEFYTQLREKKDIYDVWVDFYQKLKRLQEKWKEQKRIPKYYVKGGYENNSKSLASSKETKDSSQKVGNELEEFTRLLIEGTFNFSNISH